MSEASFIKKVLKEASDILKTCGTDGYIALQLIHLRLRLRVVHFLFQTDERRVIPVQGNK